MRSSSDHAPAKKCADHPRSPQLNWLCIGENNWCWCMTFSKIYTKSSAWQYHIYPHPNWEIRRPILTSRVYPSKSCSQKACPLLIITPPQLPLKLTRHEAVGKVLHRNHSMHDAKWGTIPGGSRSWLQHCLYRGMPVGWPNPCWHMPGFCSK